MIKGWLAALALMLLPAAPAQADEPVLVFAAASLTNALAEIAETYEAETGREVVTVFDATSRAARQISEGAPAHLMIAANRDWVDWLIACGHGNAASRRVVARNTLVLIGRGGVDQQPFDAAHPLLDSARFAIADPDGVPAGIYARQALEGIGVWEKLEDRLIRGDNVRTVLAWVSTGAAQAGIVYASDAAIAPDVSVAALVPPSLHTPVVYEGMLTTSATSASRAFLDHLGSDTARDVFAQYGFSNVPDDERVAAPGTDPVTECG